MTEHVKTYDELKVENETLRTHIAETNETLRRYTNGSNHKRYYEAHKEEVKARAKAYMERLKEEDPEKIREWHRNSRLKKKAVESTP